MRILILGGAGMLGHQLWRHFHRDWEVWVTLRQSAAHYAKFGLFEKDRSICGFDASNQEHLINAFKTARPEVVFNCIGIIKQSRDAHNPRLSLSINSLLPHRLSEIAEISQSRLIHMSTDCVFSGKKGNYTEHDFSDAEDLYGRTKFLGELPYSHTVTIRSSIIGHELESQCGLIEWFLSQRGKSIEGFTEAIYSGVTTMEMARVIELILRGFPALHGLHQIGSDPISKFDLLRLARQAYGWPGEIRPQPDFKCDRSLNSTNFRLLTNYKPPSWADMMKEMAQERARYYNV